MSNTRGSSDRVETGHEGYRKQCYKKDLYYCVIFALLSTYVINTTMKSLASFLPNAIHTEYYKLKGLDK